MSVVGDGDSSSAGEDDWISVVPPTPRSTNGIPKSPSTGSTISAGKSVFYSASEFSPSEFFGGKNSTSRRQPPQIKQFLTPNYVPPKLTTSISVGVVGEVRSSRTSLNSQKGFGLRHRASSASNALTPRTAETSTDSAYIMRVALDASLRKDTTEAHKCIRVGLYVLSCWRVPSGYGTVGGT